MFVLIGLIEIGVEFRLSYLSNALSDTFEIKAKRARRAVKHLGSANPMNNNLRGIVLKIEDRLSEDDRVRFHFYIGDNVPRCVRDDLTLCGTLCLIQCLFERNYVNDDDLTLLIDAFETIRCLDAAKLLKGFHIERWTMFDPFSSFSLFQNTEGRLNRTQTSESRPTV